jgi:hypothetical protein
MKHGSIEGIEHQTSSMGIRHQHQTSNIQTWKHGNMKHGMKHEA